jgi:hypothetical protein
MLIPSHWEASLERIARLLIRQNVEKPPILMEINTPLASNPSTIETTPAESDADEDPSTSH